METTIQPPPATKGKRGEPPRDGVQRIDVVKKSIDELIALYERKKQAGDAFDDSVEAIAKNSGFNIKALKSYIAARAKGKVPEAHAATIQLVLLFEDIQAPAN